MPKFGQGGYQPNQSYDTSFEKVETETIFSRLQRAAKRQGLQARTAESRKWLRTKAQTLRKSYNPQSIFTSGLKSQQDLLVMGRMYFMFYDPKLKDVLPYYDTFPLIFPTDFDDKGFWGINLHYLEPMMRVTLLDKLTDFANNTKYDKTTKLNLSYGLLKGIAKYEAYKPCFKRYLNSHVRSRFLHIPANEWDMAVLLPVAQFHKRLQTYVWDQSKKKIK